MRVARHGHAEQPSEQDLTRRRLEQIVATDDLADTRRGVVDDDREVVRRPAAGALRIPAPDDAVVNRRRGGSAEAISKAISSAWASRRQAAGRPARSRAARSRADSSRQVPG
jgi:hypothetical protein